MASRQMSGTSWSRLTTESSVQARMTASQSWRMNSRMTLLNLCMSAGRPAFTSS